MKFSIEWLHEWLASKVDAEKLASTFIMSGLEVESLRPAAGEFSGVIVGQVLSESMHPDAKRLHCCQVDAGLAQPLSIVCGGVNVRPGLKIALAMVGAKLPGGIEIKSTQLRGQPSLGMICSAKELGMGEDKEGCILELPTDAPIGADLREYLKLNDQIMDVSITPNRGDCLSINGLSREAAGLLKVKTKTLPPASIPAKITETLPVEVSSPQDCPRYLGRIIKGINPAAKTKVWMVERLRRSGIRSIHPVVDVTNYVMLELGQPLHAFDLAKVKGNIQVRKAKLGESLKLLDGRQLTLTPEDLTIADQSQPLALAGVMGGEESAVSSATADIFLESAFFQAVTLSLTARRHGLQTDSAYRFSRGVDFQLAPQAIERATQLILEIAGGQAGPVIEASAQQYLPTPAVIKLRREQIVRLLGIQLSDAEVEQILQAIGATVTAVNSGWQVQVPSYRYDLTLEVDLIEELARLHGYQHIPLQTAKVPMQAIGQSESQISQSRILTLLVDLGYCEAITYSFVSPRWQQWLDPQQQPLELANPISTEMSVMRTNLWPGLLQALQYNQNRQIPRVRLFETGLCFFPPAGNPEQIAMLAGAVAGLAYPEQWGSASRPVDFFDVKGDIEALLALSGQASRFSWQPGNHPALHPGQNAELLINGSVAGRVGALHPSIAESAGLSGSIYLFELKLDLINNKQLNEFKNISKFPGVRRDLAIIVPQQTPAGVIEKFILKKAGKLLNNVQIFDVYQGQGIDKGQKSIALGLTFQDASRTLKDDEIQVIVDNLIKYLEEEFNAKLRM